MEPLNLGAITNCPCGRKVYVGQVGVTYFGRTPAHGVIQGFILCPSCSEYVGFGEFFNHLQNGGNYGRA